MRIRLVLLILTFCANGMQAQTFLKHLRTKAPNGASVTVNEDAKIDELVDNDTQRSPAATPPSTVKPKTAPAAKKEPHQVVSREAAAEKERNEVRSSAERPSSEKSPVEHSSQERSAVEKTPEDTSDGEMEIATVDLRKKVMRNSYKVTGYRVQVFAGGNSRADRLKAEHIGNDIKMKFPDQPVYTHFYPPRWICRVGNYRSYPEAESMLRQVKRLGYGQACVVKGKINIQY